MTYRAESSALFGLVRPRSAARKVIYLAAPPVEPREIEFLRRNYSAKITSYTGAITSIVPVPRYTAAEL